MEEIAKRRLILMGAFAHWAEHTRPQRWAASAVRPVRVLNTHKIFTMAAHVRTLAKLPPSLHVPDYLSVWSLVHHHPALRLLHGPIVVRWSLMAFSALVLKPSFSQSISLQCHPSLAETLAIWLLDVWQIIGGGSIGGQQIKPALLGAL